MFQLRYQTVVVWYFKLVVIGCIIFLITLKAGEKKTDNFANTKDILSKSNDESTTTSNPDRFVTENNKYNNIAFLQESTEKSTKKFNTSKIVFGRTMRILFSKIKVIHPGTKWCGRGNLAKNLSDLGEYSDSDACCREHDLCPDKIKVGENKHGLENDGYFTRSNCECDIKFYDCLKKSGSQVSSNIGFTYFTVLRPKCFKEEHTIINCTKTEWGRCIKYTFDTSGKKYYQWFNNPLFLPI